VNKLCPPDLVAKVEAAIGLRDLTLPEQEAALSLGSEVERVYLAYMQEKLGAANPARLSKAQAEAIIRRASDFHRAAVEWDKAKRTVWL
jgi:alcohol dehydrogenase class IV